MVPILDLRAPRLRGGLTLFVPAALVVGVLGLLLVTSPPWFQLAACVLAGFGLSYAGGFELAGSERLAYGAVIGALITALAELALAYLVGVGRASALLGTLLALVLGMLALLTARTRVRQDFDRVRRFRLSASWPELLLLAAAWAWVLVILSRAYHYTPQGLYVGGVGFYADWAAHLTYAGAFAYGHNLPPQMPLDPPHRLGYPFLIDFWAAELVPLGASLTAALVYTSGLLLLAFPAVMYLAVKRVLGGRLAPILAVLVFCLGGGLGFVALVPELLRLGPGVLIHLPRLYTQDSSANLQWLNPVLAYMIPQRSVLFGFSLALITTALLFGPQGAGRRGLLALGALSGLTPLAHVHAWGTEVALPAFSVRPAAWRRWATYFVPALVLGLPVVLWLVAGGVAQLRWQAWWLADTAGHHDSPLWFWFKNTGFLIPAMAAGFVWSKTLPPTLGRRLAPIWLWFLVPNFIVFQPWDWDNTKFFAYWALIGSIPAAAFLARLFAHSRWAAGAAALLLVSLCLAGALDLSRALDPAQNTFQFTDAGGVRVAAWARQDTPPQAIFLVAPQHNSPIPTLAGRKVVEGYPGWLWTYGLRDWATRTGAVETMLEGKSGTLALIRRYHVSYVLIGPQELDLWHADAAYWAASGFQKVYSEDGYTVYRT